MNILELPFDIYQRYKIIQNCVEVLRPDGHRTFQVLDAGGGNGPIAGFFPNDKIILVDRSECDLPNFQKADVLALPFKDHSFDIVISTDVLEHVSPAQREQFLGELWRVSRHYILLAAPFHAGAVVQAEKILFEFIKARLGYEHQFLKEHRDNGLPHCAETRAYLEQLGADTVTLPNGFLSHWLPMMLITYYLEGDPKSVPLSRLISAFYNESYYPSDNCEPAYRSLIIAGKQPLPEPTKARLQQLASPAPKALDFAPIVPLVQLFQIDTIRERERLLSERLAHVSNLHRPAGRPEPEAPNREAARSDLKERIAGWDARRGTGNTQTPSLEQELANRAARIAALEAALREKERMIKTILQDKEQQVDMAFQEKDRHIDEVAREKEEQIQAIIRARDEQIAMLLQERAQTETALSQRLAALEQELAEKAACIDSLVREREQVTDALLREKDRHVYEVFMEKEKQIQDIVQARDAQIAQLARERDEVLAAVTQRMKTLEQERADQAAHLANLEAVIREKDLMIEAAHQEKEQITQALLREKDRHVDEVVMEKEQQIQDIIKARDRQISLLCKDRDETLASVIRERNALWDAKSAEIESLKSELLRKEETVNELGARLVALKAELEARNHQLDRLQAFVDRVKRTWPYRLYRRLHSPT